MFENLREMMVSPGIAVVINSDTALFKPEHQPGVFYPGVEALVQHLRDFRRRVGIVSQRPDSAIQVLVKQLKVDGKTIDDTFPREGIVGSTTLATLAKTRHQSLLGVQFAATRVEELPRPIVMYIGGGRRDALTVAGQRGMLGLVIQEKGLAVTQRALRGYGNLYFRDSLERVFTER